MKKHAFLTKVSALAMAAAMACSSMSVLAAPKTMSDGGLFDAEYYAAANPDVVAAMGTSEEALYQHYKLAGAAEGRQPYLPAVTETSEQTKARLGASDLPVNTKIEFTFNKDEDGKWFRLVLNEDRKVKIHTDIRWNDLYDEAGQLIYEGSFTNEELFLGRGSYFVHMDDGGTHYLEFVQEDKLDGSFVMGGRSKEAAVGIPLNTKIYGLISREEGGTTGRWYYFQLTTPQQVKIMNNVFNAWSGGSVNVYDANENLLFDAAEVAYSQYQVYESQMLPAGIYYIKIADCGRRNFSLIVQ